MQWLTLIATLFRLLVENVLWAWRERERGQLENRTRSLEEQARRVETARAARRDAGARELPESDPYLRD